MHKQNGRFRYFRLCCVRLPKSRLSDGRLMVPGVVPTQRGVKAQVRVLFVGPRSLHDIQKKSRRFKNRAWRTRKHKDNSRWPFLLFIPIRCVLT